MKFIKQNNESTDVINMDYCSSLYTQNINQAKYPFVIRFMLGTSDEDNFQTWRYKKESVRDQQFKNICELVEVQSIGN